ncbi:MAG TPA: sigma-70 family RNA polymerase sigma factor [Bacteroidales bacterium]|nr:sigma-70 family RNA polymerase sigma factor [Bacteroidales bacterium]HOK99346.1 sigma-70 family RNA polymerase sigma factor [Bacteroidales bacterium]HPO65844.1 sigma-70 family RNA polymerase sigma factor [Bacteroidales bacterium]
MEVSPNLSEKALQDLQLVKRALAGDQRAYADLLSKYKDAIYFMLLKMVNNQDDAEDLTIEAFGKAFNNLHQYTPNFAFSTWLFKIATNNCIDFFRKQRGGKTVPIEQTTEDKEEIIIPIRTEDLNPEENLITQQKINMMREIVNKLKPRYRKLIELRYFEELSYEEIAEKLELPIGTVKAQLFRARELLYNILKNANRHF